MKNSDKNSIPFIQYGDTEYIAKLKKIDKALNKAIDELLNLPNYSGDLGTAMYFIFDDDIIYNKIQVSEGLEYNAGTISVADSVAPPEPGNIFLIGRNSSMNGWGLADGEFITGERIPAVSNVFNYTTATLDKFIQVPKLERPFWFPSDAGVEFNNMYLCAIDGNAAISAQISGSEQRYVTVTKYLQNENMLRYTDWAAATVPTIYPVDCGANLLIEGVFVMFPGKFVVKSTPVGDNITLFNLPIVIYAEDEGQSSGFFIDIHFLPIDLVEMGYEDFIFFPPGGLSRWAVNASKSQISIIFHMTNISFAQYSLNVVVDVRSNSIVYSQMYGGHGDISPVDNIDGFTDEYIFDVELDYEAPYTYDASYNNHRLKGVDPTGENIVYSIYESRSLDGGGAISFIGESADTEVDIVAQLDAHAVACGFTLTGSIKPSFGDPSTYITDNPPVLPGTQLMHSDGTGSYYSWFDYPAPEGSGGWPSVGWHAGLTTSAPGDSAMGQVYPPTYGPHLGWGMGYVSETTDGGPTYFYLALKNPTGDENYKLTGTSILSPLFTATATYILCPSICDTPLYMWLTSHEGIPFQGEDGFDITIENLDE